MITETFDDYQGRITLQRFENVTEWYRYAEGSSNYPLNGTARYNHTFYGVQSIGEAVRYCEENIGEEHMRAAKDLVNRVDASFRDRDQTHWRPSPFGAYPIVPDYLAGDPFSMRRKELEEDTRAPIRYFIEGIVSSGVKQWQLEQRAAGLAALIMRTAEERPVELYDVVAIASRGTGYLAVIPITTHPVDLHSTIAAFATREFCRCMAFGSASRAVKQHYHSSRIDWLFGAPTGRGKITRDRTFRKVLGMAPQDVFMQGGYLDDADDFQRDPVAWVHQQIEKQRSIEE